MPATPENFVLGELGIRWTNPPSCLHGFQGQAEPVMEFCGDGMEFAHGIGWCRAEAAHFLANGTGGMLSANADWSRVFTHSADPEGALALAAICARFAAFDGLLIHGALVDCEGSGVLFTGPSGIGKTTQAELWQRWGAEIINGDKVLLRCRNYDVYGYGLPWKGSSPYCLNRRVPLRGIVALRQSRENRIRRLTDLECMEYFLPHIFLPRWDETCYLRGLDTVDRLIQQVPVYLLECRPDSDSVVLTRNTLQL